MMKLPRQSQESNDNTVITTIATPMLNGIKRYESYNNGNHNFATCIRWTSDYKLMCCN